MLVALLVAGQLVGQEPPRFTMTPEPGDTTKAEVFELRTPDIPAEAASLLPGDGPVEVREHEGMGTVHRAGSLPIGPIVVYPGPRNSRPTQYACRLTRDPQGTNENAVRAGRWCESFVTERMPVLAIPPIPAPSPG